MTLKVHETAWSKRDQPPPGETVGSNDIGVRVIENAVLVKSKEGWFSFADWPAAAHHIGARIEKLKKNREATNA